MFFVHLYKRFCLVVKFSAVVYQAFLSNTNNLHTAVWFQEFLSNTDNYKVSSNYFFLIIIIICWHTITALTNNN